VFAVNNRSKNVCNINASFFSTCATPTPSTNTPSATVWMLSTPRQTHSKKKKKNTPTPTVCIITNPTKTHTKNTTQNNKKLSTPSFMKITT
jgi:hypothetical protein